MNNLLPSSQAANHAGSPEKPSLVTRGAGPWLHISAQSLWACSELSPFTVFLGRSSKKAQQLSLTAFISRWQTSLENREGFLEPPQEQSESNEWFPVGQNHSGKQKPYGGMLTQNLCCSGQIPDKFRDKFWFQLGSYSAASQHKVAQHLVLRSCLILSSYFKMIFKLYSKRSMNVFKTHGKWNYRIFPELHFHGFLFLSEARLPTAVNGALFVMSRGQCLHCTEDRSLSHQGQRYKARSGR